MRISKRSQVLVPGMDVNMCVNMSMSVSMSMGSMRDMGTDERRTTTVHAAKHMKWACAHRSMPIMIHALLIYASLCLCDVTWLCVSIPSPHGDLRVVIRNTLVGIRTGPEYFRRLLLAPAMRSSQT